MFCRDMPDHRGDEVCGNLVCDSDVVFLHGVGDVLENVGEFAITILGFFVFVLDFCGCVL